MRKLSYRPNFLLILYCINIFLIFLAPYAYSIFEGQIHGRNSKIDFKVGFLGSWLEHRIFYGFSEGSSMGSAKEIGIYNNSIVILLILGLVFCIFGASIVSIRSKQKESEDVLYFKKGLFITRLCGILSSILGGLFGVLSLILFSLFKSTIIQPYDARDAFPLNNTPPIRFAPSFYLSLVVYLVFVIIGILYLINSINTNKQLKEQMKKQNSNPIIGGKEEEHEI